MKILEILAGMGVKFKGPILENPEGRGGVIRQIASIGVVWIFFGTSHRANQLAGETITIKFLATCYNGGSTLSACEI